jgi:hypothetical protein
MGEFIEGGCFCGAARYRVRNPPVDAGYCHCRMCQRSVGAPVVAWGSWPSDSFQWLTAAPATLDSSVEGRRQFCPCCGTQLLFWTTAEPEIVDVNLATLDDPAAIAPEYHVWTASRIPWFETADALPRYPDAGRDRPGLREGS